MEDAITLAGLGILIVLSIAIIRDALENWRNK